MYKATFQQITTNEHKEFTEITINLIQVSINSHAVFLRRLNKELVIAET